MGLDGFDISEEFYNLHEMEFFMLINSYKKYENKFDEKTLEFRIFIDSVRNGTDACHENFAKFLKLDIIQKLWNCKGSS